MADFDTDVLVVGAGPTGLTLASILARHGVACRIVDKEAAPATQSRALGIHARTLEAFDLMGILPGFLERGHVVHGVEMRSEGKQVMHVRLDDVDSVYPFVLVLSQTETERLLTEHLASLGIAPEPSLSLTSFQQDAKGVTSTLDRSGEPVTIRSRWIAGCDGAHSAVRHGLGLKFEGAPYSEQFALADVHLDWAVSNDEMCIFAADPGLAAFFPMGGDLWRIVIGTKQPAADAESAPPTIDDIRGLTAEMVDLPLEIRDSIWTARFRIHRRIVERLRSGRAFLAGDAADIHSPAGGQGMNTGIQSAQNLAWKLAMVIQGNAPEAILDSYNAERHPVEMDVLRGTDLLTRLITASGPVAHWVRESMLPFLTHRAFIQQRIIANVSEVAVGYRKSPIVEEHRVADSNLRAGDHAPDGRVYHPITGESKRLTELLDPVRHTLLVFTGPVIDRPLAGHEDERDDAEIVAPYLGTFSGVGGAPAMPIPTVGVVTDKALMRDELHSVVSTGKTVMARYDSVIAGHLIARDENQTYGYDWPCDTWIDKDDSVHERYGRIDPSLYLIRPDGYVAFRASAFDADRLPTYLDRLLGEPVVAEAVKADSAEGEKS